MTLEPEAQLVANIAVWDERATRLRGLPLPSREQTRELATQLGCPPGSLILDLGCGAGRWSVGLVREGYRVLGVDPSPNMAAEALDRASSEGLSAAQANFAEGDAEHIPSGDAAFDGVFCFAVLDFVPNPGVALQEMWRVLRPGGRLVLGVHGAYSPVKREYWRRFLPGDAQGRLSHIANHILPWEVAALLDALGWEVLAQQPTFGPAASGATNPYTADTATRLDDPVLQQTIATSWTFVARKAE